MLQRLLPFFVIALATACSKPQTFDASGEGEFTDLQLETPSTIPDLNLNLELHPGKGTNSGCHNRLAGEWEIGRAPFGCEIAYNTALPLTQNYPSLIFDDGAQRANETKRYTKEMYNFLMDYSVAYFKRRSPEAPQSAIEKWTHLVLATAHQESYWTHYRLGGDNIFRFFKGDYDHGYGLMQVDARSHRVFINSGKVFDITQHFLYALDILYDSRAAALKKPCANAADPDSINRSAYSGYNGGLTAKCRWKNPSHRWARNDKNFYDKYRSKEWEDIIRP